MWADDWFGNLMRPLKETIICQHDDVSQMSFEILNDTFLSYMDVMDGNWYLSIYIIKSHAFNYFISAGSRLKKVNPIQATR